MELLIAGSFLGIGYLINKDRYNKENLTNECGDVYADGIGTSLTGDEMNDTDINTPLCNDTDKYPDDNERMDYATVKFMEIANIKNDNNEFIKK